jgi:hypothetical protein
MAAEIDSNNNYHYTDLETRQIYVLSCITRQKHRQASINDIEDISKDMIHDVYYDERVKSIYDKKKITLGALHKLYADAGSPKMKSQHSARIKEHEPEIDILILHETNKRLKENEVRTANLIMCERCSQSCIIL